MNHSTFESRNVYLGPSRDFPEIIFAELMDISVPCFLRGRWLDEDRNWTEIVVPYGLKTPTVKTILYGIPSIGVVIEYVHYPKSQISGVNVISEPRNQFAGDISDIIYKHLHAGTLE